MSSNNKTGPQIHKEMKDNQALMKSVIEFMRLKQWAVEQAVKASNVTSMNADDIISLTTFFYEFSLGDSPKAIKEDEAS